MPDKPSSPPGKSDATDNLKKAFSEFEAEVLDTVEKKADDTVSSEASKVESAVTGAEQKIETGIDDAIDRIKPDAKPKKQAAADPRITDAPPHSAMQDYRGLAFQSNPAQAAPPGGDPQSDPPAGNSDAADTSALNQAMVQAVGFQNQEVKSYAPTMIVTPPDQMIGQAAGLAAQASAQYFDSMTKIIMSSQSVMLKKMAENVAAGNIGSAAEDGLVIAETELLLAAAMAVAAAGGAMEAEAASFGISKINESVQSRTGKSSDS
ncbi:hypothetical protein [uncultured Tateyamaria sp.]|uniref:hypothetical protein n=1 Tax=uncultured Tateyamaria sp. TaxID=455651 RepID=UPI002618A8CD|nr:hypothetical protein [uncultured Tateyamaria sp.]